MTKQSKAPAQLDDKALDAVSGGPGADGIGYQVADTQIKTQTNPVAQPGQAKGIIAVKPS